MIPRPRPRGWVRALAWTSLALLYVPLLVIVAYSFGSQGWENYRLLFARDDIRDALELSLEIGLISAVIATVLGTMAAFALERYRFPGKRFFELLLMFPIAMPEIVLGLSTLIWYVFIHFTLGFWSIALAHVTFTMAYVVLVVQARIRDFDRSLEDAAADLGANRWQTFWHVTVPLIFPGILSGALLAFTLSFDDFLISLFTSGAGLNTLPMKVYSFVRFGFTRELNALSTLLFLTTILLVLLVFRPFKNLKNPVRAAGT